MSSKRQEMLNQLIPVVTVIPHEYVDAILSLHEKLGNIKWTIDGDLGECLRAVQVEPEKIELLCDTRDLEKIFTSIKDFNPTAIALVTDKLPRNAVVDGKEYPVYVRSHQLMFTLKDVKVKVKGDLQFRIGDWEWGNPLEFTPEYVYVVGKKTAVMPLSLAAQLYQGLGWMDRVQKIMHVMHYPFHQK
jgi:hypothetical protein